MGTPFTEVEFTALVRRNEGQALDFKATAYNLSLEGDKASLIKDVLSIANTPREEEGYIVLGVKRHPDV